MVGEFGKEEIKVEARTYNEAVQKAVKLLKSTPQDLEIEVLDNEKKGFLGIGYRPVVIVARLKYPNESHPHKSRTGYAQVKAGKICVEGDDPPATIITNEHFELILNGKQVEGEIEVKPEDVIEVRPKVEKELGYKNLKISSDGLKAILSIKPGYQKIWKLKDSGPSTKLKLQGEPEVVVLPSITREELENELKNQKIVYGIDEKAIEKALTASKEEEIIIAEGVPPVAGVDGRVECLFSEEEVSRIEVDEREKIDYREMVIRPSVKVGDVVAVKVPPKPGQPGKDVFGNELLPAEPKDFQLVDGEGTKVDNGQSSVALIEGRPYFKQRGRKIMIDILPVLLHSGDVNLESGNLKFKGIINISGDVTETMKVDATQDVEIGGSINQAEVYSGGSILVNGNCIGSSLIAGGLNSVYQSAKPILRDLSKQLSSLKEAILQLKKIFRSKKHKGEFKTGYLIMVLVKEKFSGLPVLVKELNKIKAGIKEGFEEQLIKLCTRLNHAFIDPVSVQALNIKVLEQLLDDVQETLNYCEQKSKDGGNIICDYALNSKLNASGWVKVKGKGCYNTHIVAGGSVNIQGVFRGGSIYAADNVFLKEMGSRGGVRTSVRVDKGKYIKAGKIWPNCKLEIDNQIIKIGEEKHQIMAYINKEGNLIVSSY
ncbi:MAG: uncharacterized protein PWP31_631 [Clostridia bacterium]|nr:uncharacterized protein [Clostridia bacterium]